MSALLILKSSLGPAYGEQREGLLREFVSVTQTRLAAGEADAYTDAATLLGMFNRWQRSLVVC
jgi:hypothetical protein